MDTTPGRLLELARGQVESHALVLMDLHGVVVDWLAGAERMFGYAREEIVGRNIALLFVAEDLALHIDAWERGAATIAGLSEDDRWQLRKDGGRIWVDGATAALRDGQGNVVGYAKIMRERTEQKTQLEAAEARLAELERAQDQRVEFVSTLAHELRNPLGTVSNAVGVLELASGTTPQVAFAAGMIRRQVDAMTRLVSDLLELTRSAVGKVELRRERLVLQDAVADSLEGCRPALQRHSHTVHRLLAEGAIEVDADRMRLQQVLVNLLENAAKYTPPGGTIWIKATTEGEEAVVQVRDTGIGIAPELMPHIFDLFTQGRAARRAGTGLGIGLALVRDTVALHGGSVQATSDGVGKGSQFTVRLPLPNPPRRP